MIYQQEETLSNLKEKLIQILENYDEDLRYEYELQEIDDALSKINQLIQRLK